jgi:pimeloyl-ACP methyl ester carboxylesterase
MRLLRAACLLAGAAALAACASTPVGEPQPPTGTSAAAASSSPPSAPLTGIAAECGVPQAEGRRVELRTRDRVVLSAIETGNGRVGVVLLHQLRGGACGWWPYAARLADLGYAVEVPDLRCFGSSTCPDAATASKRHDLDVAAAVERLGERGATRVVVVGASMGAAVAVEIASQPPEGVVSAIALSPPMSFPVWLPEERKVGTAGSLAGDVRIPLLLVTSPGDRDAPPELVEEFAVQAGQLVRVVRLDRPGHGWNLLRAGVAGEETWTPVAAQIEQVIAQAAAVPQG